MDKLFETDTLFVLLIFGIPIVAVIASYWFKIEKTKSNNDLKRRMIDAGMSVEEIERVLKAGDVKD